MKPIPITAFSALVALMMSGFVPAPAAVSIMSGAAEAATGSQGSVKGKKTTKRKGKKKKASSSKQRAKAAKGTARKAEGKAAKTKTRRVASKRAGTKRKKGKRGRRNAGNFTAHSQAAVAGANMQLSVGSERPVSLAPPPPPLPPRAPQAARKTAKAAPSPARQAAAAALKRNRQATGQTTKSALLPAGSRNTAVSSVITRQIQPGGATQIAAPPAPKPKMGERVRIMFRSVLAKLGING